MRSHLSVLLALAALGQATAALAQHAPDRLARRADLGAVISPPSAGKPSRVVRIDDGSSLFSAGLRAGDEIVSLNGGRFSDAIDFDRRVAALRGGQQVTLAIVRDGQSRQIRTTLPPMVRETIPDVEVVYTQIANPHGTWQRAILTRPQSTTRRLPAILFVPWLSCDSVESPGVPSPGIDELLIRIAAHSGWVMLRVDKPGVGDSEGDCSTTDLDTEIDGSRAALHWLRAHPWVEPSRVVLMGQSFSGGFLPLVAQDTPVAGYIVINGWVRTWLERLLEFERLQAEASGMSPADVSERQRKLAEFYTLFLERQKTPRAIVAERPDLASVWSDAPEHQYGRPARFHHQLQRINAARAWSGVSVPTLVMWSDADLVMHRTDHERIVALVNRNRRNAAELVIIPGADHGVGAPGPEGRRQVPAIVLPAIRTFLDRVNGGTDAIR